MREGGDAAAPLSTERCARDRAGTLGSPRSLPKSRLSDATDEQTSGLREVCGDTTILETFVLALPPFAQASPGNRSPGVRRRGPESQKVCRIVEDCGVRTGAESGRCRGSKSAWVSGMRWRLGRRYRPSCT